MRHDRDEFLHWFMPRVIVAVIIAVVVTLGLIWQAKAWNECRAFGHSILYCLRTVR